MIRLILFIITSFLIAQAPPSFTLKEVNVEGNDVYLQLGGGCQGCGMAQVTLSKGIEASLKEAIPEIGNVIDATDHSSGQNPYFAGSKK